jgi:hypothetical protein
LALSHNSVPLGVQAGGVAPQPDETVLLNADYARHDEDGQSVEKLWKAFVFCYFAGESLFSQ